VLHFASELGIRLRAQKERALISELNAQLGVELSKTLELASSLLDDVEEFFLDAEILQEPGLGDCPPGSTPARPLVPKPNWARLRDSQSLSSRPSC